jgi:hypothetical protein
VILVVNTDILVVNPHSQRYHLSTHPNLFLTTSGSPRATIPSRLTPATSQSLLLAWITTPATSSKASTLGPALISPRPATPIQVHSSPAPDQLVKNILREHALTPTVTHISVGGPMTRNTVREPLSRSEPAINMLVATRRESAGARGRHIGRSRTKKARCARSVIRRGWMPCSTTADMSVRASSAPSRSKSARSVGRQSSKW